MEPPFRDQKPLDRRRVIVEQTMSTDKPGEIAGRSEAARLGASESNVMSTTTITRWSQGPIAMTSPTGITSLVRIFCLLFASLAVQESLIVLPRGRAYAETETQTFAGSRAGEEREIAAI
jgi:hypothetical protein